MISLSNFGLILTKDEVTLGIGLNEVLGISNKCFVLIYAPNMMESLPNFLLPGKAQSLSATSFEA